MTRTRCCLDLPSFRMLECPNCGYSLKGLSDKCQCPECGRRCDKDSYLIRRQRLLTPIDYLAEFVVLQTAWVTYWRLRSGSLDFSVFELLTLVVITIGVALTIRAYHKYWHRSEYFVIDGDGVAWRERGRKEITLSWSEIVSVTPDPQGKTVLLHRGGDAKAWKIPRAFRPKRVSADEFSEFISARRKDWIYN